jgi:CAP-Gly domain
VQDYVEEPVALPPPPVPSKESKKGDQEPAVVSVPTSRDDKKLSASSTLSTNSGSTIRVVLKKKSNDTITERTENDVSTLRATALAKLVGTTPGPGPGATSRPSALEAVSPSTSPVANTVMARTQTQAPTQRPISPLPEPPPTAVPAMYAAPSRPQFVPVTNPQGITLNVGIPCIITSKRARFRAFARYLGEVAGEAGPWVGVEVPLGEFAGGDKLGSRDWHDGSWNGIRYFDIQGSAWEEDERGGRKRRPTDPYGTVKGGRKRDADSLSVETRERSRMRSVSPAVSDASVYESRGLFIRPQQVLFVIGAREDY